MSGRTGPNAQPVNKNIDQPQDTRLPSWLILHVAHAYQSTKEIFGADVIADFSCRDGSVQEPADRLRQLIERKRVKF